jgi:hypothetical protein
MKKWVLTPVTLIIIGGIFFLFLSRRSFSKTVVSPCSIAAADRCFEDVAGWDRWWPKNSHCGYKIEGVYYNDIRLSIQCADGSTLSGDMRLAPLAQDSTLINWRCKLPLLARDKEIRRTVDSILQAFKTFIEDSRNIYSGVRFYRTMSKNCILVTLTSIGAAYPTTAEVYAKIDSLRKYFVSQKAAAIDSPMLNVSKISPTQFRMTVAIPVNKLLSGDGRISIKNFVPWKMLEGDVHGGPYTAEKAFEEMQKFKIDNNISIMALPYQSLITDRRKVQDTTKWVTIICAPIS